MSGQEGLAAIIHEHIWGAEYPTDEADCCADAVLASPWLRAHDDRIRADALAPVLAQLAYAASPTMGLPSGVDPAEWAMTGPENLVRGALRNCIQGARAALRAAAGTPTHHTTEEDTP